MENFTVSTSSTNTTIKFEATWDKIVVAIVLYAITVVTIFGNILVLVAVKTEKKLRTTFNYYIVNLAITDVSVAITAMSFMATHTVLGYWPFGELLCAVWIFFDYGMTFVSVFTLILISVDRFWSVTWSVSYRKYHTKKKCVISIVAVWVFMLFLWVPPWIVDRLRYSQPDVCFWDPSLNKEFVYIVAVLGHHGPYCTMIFCYTYVFIFMHKRTNLKISDMSRVTNSVDTSRDQASDVASTSRDQPKITKVHPVRPFSPPPQTISSQEYSKTHVTVTFLRVPKTPTSQSENSTLVVQEQRLYRDKKVFVTLSYIIIGYAILWLPFHVVFDISISSPHVVPEEVRNLSFWMAYFNSTINPFLYNFSSPEFRRAFRRLLGRGKC